MFTPPEDMSKMNFIRSNSFRQNPVSEFDSELNGLDTFAVLFHNKDAQNIDLYNGWNFTKLYIWDSLTPDSFWYSKNTLMLF